MMSRILAKMHLNTYYPARANDRFRPYDPNLAAEITKAGQKELARLLESLRGPEAMTFHIKAKVPVKQVSLNEAIRAASQLRYAQFIQEETGKTLEEAIREYPALSRFGEGAVNNLLSRYKPAEPPISTGKTLIEPGNNGDFDLKKRW